MSCTESRLYHERGTRLCGRRVGWAVEKAVITMNFRRMSLGKRMLVILSSMVLALAVLSAAVVIWVMATAYRPDAIALKSVADEDGALDGVTVHTLDDGSIAFEAEEPIAGMIFYPGAMVEAESYAPLLTRLAQNNVTSVVVQAPLNIALLDGDAATGVMAQLPEFDQWYVGGHSLGGVVACSYAHAHPDDVKGVVLLAAYPNDDLADFSGELISIVGTNDGVLNWTSYDEARDMLPASAEELRIEGGNHAYYGNYGEQKKDGVATITREQQQEQVVEAVTELVQS